MGNLFGTIDTFNVRVEIPEGSSVKYEYSEELGTLVADFIFQDGFTWPFNYGEILGTKGGDGDKLDAIVLSSHPLHPGSIAVCRAIAMAEIVDRGEVDNKIICVPVVDRDLEFYQDLDSLSEEQLRSYEDFFRELAVQKNKIMEIKGFHNRERAEEEIEKSVL